MKQSVINERMNVTYVTDFDSISDMVSYNKTSEINRMVFRTQSSINGNKSFTMTGSYNEAEQLLLNGWSEGAKKLTTQLKIENVKNNKEVKRAIFDVVGFQASVPRYLQGVPQNMINKKSVKQKQYRILATI